jgi:signal-transduction protein with cAMP-binding, CBS, and nucleotidyltransferase domain
VRDLFSIEADHKVALGWFGRLKMEPETSERPGTINLKLAGTLPLVEAARLLSLKEGIRECRTLERLDALRAKGRLGEQEHDYLRYAFGVITEAMLRRQIEEAKAGREADDFVPESALTRRQKDQLVAALRAIEDLRGRLSEELTSTVI